MHQSILLDNALWLHSFCCMPVHGKGWHASSKLLLVCEGVWRECGAPAPHGYIMADGGREYAPCHMPFMLLELSIINGSKSCFDTRSKALMLHYPSRSLQSHHVVWRVSLIWGVCVFLSAGGFAAANQA